MYFELDRAIKQLGNHQRVKSKSLFGITFENIMKITDSSKIVDPNWFEIDWRLVEKYLKLKNLPKWSFAI